MIGIQDSEFQERELLEKGKDEIRDGQRAAIERELRHMHLVDDFGTSIANPERQKGTMKSYHFLEKELREIDPNIRILEMEGNLTKARVMYGTRQVCVTERLMPEYSVWTEKAKEVPIIYDGTISLDAPATEEVAIPWNEDVRGWRTVLLRLVTLGYVPLAKIEKKFGKPERASWAHHTRQKFTEGII